MSRGVAPLSTQCLADLAPFIAYSHTVEQRRTYLGRPEGRQFSRGYDKAKKRAVHKEAGIIKCCCYVRVLCAPELRRIIEKMQMKSNF